MRRFVLTTLLIGLVATAMAQGISVKSFMALPMDLTATSQEGKRIDQNGDAAALIRVVTKEKGFVFEGGSLGIVDTQQRTGEIWVWVPKSARKISILHQDLGVLRDYRYPVDIESGRTYEMVLVTGSVETVVKPSVTQQFLVFKVTPADALLTVDEIPWPLIDGVSQKMVDFGQHTYRIEAQDYHTEAGVIKVEDAEHTVVKEVELRPSCGYLKIEGDLSVLSASLIYVDNMNGASTLREYMKLQSGKHRVRIVHSKFKPYDRVIEIGDLDTCRLSVDLNANYTKLTLEVDADVPIYVNNVKVGVRTWTGEVEEGACLLETRLPNHKPGTLRKTITADMAGQTIKLPAPKPINGTLVVSSTPSIAKLFIDDQEMGETPLRINTILVGNHVLKLEKPDYMTVVKSITIEEGKTLTLDEVLSKADGTAPINPLPEPVEKPEKKLETIRFVTLDGAFGTPLTPSFGFSVGSGKKVGWFVSAMSNFKFDALNYEVATDANGLIDNAYPFSQGPNGETGEEKLTRISAVAGVLFRTGIWGFRLGAGYGRMTLSKYARPSHYNVAGMGIDTDPGQLIKVSNLSYEGVDVTVGAQLFLKGFTLSLDAVSTNFKTMEAKLGLGYCW